MSYTQVKIDDHLHQKMKKLAGSTKGAITEEYRVAITNHIAMKTQENIIKDTNLESYINDRITKAEKHLASMLARTGMDTSMNLMAAVILLSKLLKVNEVEIQNELRKRGARYFANAIKKDKETAKESKE